MEDPIDKVLNKLDNRKSSGPGKWIARCPAHEDQSPSLSVGIGDDGRVLLKCFTGCTPEEVCQAIDLTMADLFPAKSDHAQRNGTGKTNGKSKPKSINWAAKEKEYKDNLTPDLRGELARALGLPDRVFEIPSIGFNPGGWRADKKCEEPCFTFAETDHQGNIVGITQRFRDGAKFAMAGGQRGLFILPDVDKHPGALFLVEGASDALALAAMSLAAIGRPSATAGLDHLAKWLEKKPATCQIVVLGENDQRIAADGRENWPGRKGAIDLATDLAKRLKWPILWALPPAPAKDVREWATKIKKLDPIFYDAWSDAGEELENFLLAAAKQVDPPSGTTSAPQLITRKLSEVQRKTVTWLWPGRIPRGMITMLDGDPDLGKSTLTLDLAARVSRGLAMPPGGGPGDADPADVLLLSAEDDLSRIVIPRLEAAGADLERIHTLDAVRVEGGERPPVLPQDIKSIQDLILKHHVVLVIVDPIMAYLNGVDAHRDQEVRFALHQLKVMAEETGAAILMVRHLNKMTSVGNAMYRGGGSIGIIGAARSGLLVGSHPDEKDVCVLATTKSNLCRRPRALTYGHEPVGDVARLAWGKECDLSADDILARPSAANPNRQSMREQCAAAIRDYLADGPKLVAEMEEYLKDMGYSERGIKEGRKLAKVKPIKEDFSGRWMASLSPTKQEGDEEARPIF